MGVFGPGCVRACGYGAFRGMICGRIFVVVRGTKVIRMAVCGRYNGRVRVSRYSDL